MTRSSRAAVAVPVRATRRNTTCDRKAGAGSVIPCHRRALVKRGGAGAGNWGRLGDELYDYDYQVIDSTEPSAEEARWGEKAMHLRRSSRGSSAGTPHRCGPKL